MSAHFQHRPATDDVIRAGYANKTRVAEIAAFLGTTKNVVIGRASRLGLARPTPHLAGIPRRVSTVHLKWCPEAWLAMADAERERFLDRYLSEASQ